MLAATAIIVTTAPSASSFLDVSRRLHCLDTNADIARLVRAVETTNPSWLP